VFALVVTLACATGAAAREPIAWTEAAQHVDRLVTVEGVIARGETTPEGRCILWFDAGDPRALRVVLIRPLVSDLPREPQRLFQGKRVQVSGRVMRFQDHLEMAVTPAQIEVVGLTATPPPAAPTAPPPAAVSPPRAPTAAPTPAPPPSPAAMPARSAPPPTPAPAPVPTAPPTTPPTTVAPDPACRQLEDDRAAVRAELREQNEALQRCLAEGRSGCAALGDRLGPLLSRLEAVEQQLARRCP
jgi:hypothetical protein